MDQVLALIMIVGQEYVFSQLLQVTQHQALAQNNHLVAGIVVIVFPLHGVSRCFQQARHGIADHGVARMADMVSGPLGLALTNSTCARLPAPIVELKTALALANDIIDLASQVFVAEFKVDEAGRDDFNALDIFKFFEGGNDQPGKIKRLLARMLGQPHCRVGEVALSRASRRTDGYGGNLEFRQISGGLRLAQRFMDLRFQFPIEQFQES